MCVLKYQHIHLYSVQFSHSVMSDSLWPHGPPHARAPCPSSIPGVYPNSCPLSRWCHPTTSSSVVPFSSHLQSFPASGSLQMSPFFTSGSQSIAVSICVCVFIPSNWLLFWGQLQHFTNFGSLHVYHCIWYYIDRPW